MEKPIAAAILSVASTKLSDEEKRLLERSNPLGISLFAQNIANKSQIKKLIKDVKEAVGRDDVLIGVDQEGGRVRRLVEPEFRAYCSQRTLGNIAEPKAKEQTIKYHATLISNDLKELGININYAPCLDLCYEYTHKVLQSRCLSDNAQEVATAGKILVDEYIKNGICPCIKHLPGHGRTVNDPHLGLPILDYSIKELEQDFYPFMQLKDAPMGMTAHVLLPQIDDINPITQSTKGIKEIIRKAIGFDGMLISDAIDMKALKGTAGEKSRNCINAGCDAVCYCLGQIAEMEEVIANCGFLTDKSMIRFAKIKNVIKNRVNDNNIEQIAAKYQSVIGKIEKYDDGYDATEVLHQMGQQPN